jgi:uncharacterized membrane protein
MGTNTSRPSNPGTSLPRVWLFALLFLCAFGSFWFVRRDAIGYLSLNQQSYTDYYWPRRYGILIHVCAGMLVLSAGLIQVYLGLTGRTNRVHRWLGRLYMSGVLIAVSASLYLVTQIPVSMYSVGLFGLAIAWITTTSAGYWAATHGRIAEHRVWMIRSYVVTFGFVSLRTMQNVMMATRLADEETSVTIAAWLCWIIPLGLVELFIRRQSVVMCQKL